MDVKSFQNKLGEIIELARYNNRRLEAGLVEDFFRGDGLDEEKMKSVFEYLKSQGIRVNDGKDETVPDKTEIPFVEREEPDPLSPEEEIYLKEYTESLVCTETVSGERRERLFQAYREGTGGARQELMESYLPEVVKIVKELHRSDIFVGDMIQEGNLGLLSALDSLEEKCPEDPHVWILQQVTAAVKDSIRNQREQKWEDDCLISRVEKLESAVRDLVEDAGDKFSVEELSAFLDMSVEEIRDVLRLTGDDK